MITNSFYILLGLPTGQQQVSEYSNITKFCLCSTMIFFLYRTGNWSGLCCCLVQPFPVSQPKQLYGQQQGYYLSNFGWSALPLCFAILCPADHCLQCVSYFKVSVFKIISMLDQKMGNINYQPFSLTWGLQLKKASYCSLSNYDFPQLH